MVWEYPYQYGHAQEDLQDLLMICSLNGIQVLRPRYQSTFHWPAAREAHESCEKTKTYQHHISNMDVDKNVNLVGNLDEADQG